MAQPRNLIPTSLYLQPEHVDEADERAAQLGVARATLLRMITTGSQYPLGLDRTRQTAWMKVAGQLRAVRS